MLLHGARCLDGAWALPVRHAHGGAANLLNLTRPPSEVDLKLTKKANCGGAQEVQMKRLAQRQATAGLRIK